MKPASSDTTTDPELPEDVADAWASVLLDVWEKQSQSRPDAPAKGNPQVGNDDVAEDPVHAG